MKALDEPYRDLMQSQRNHHLLNFVDLAILLNCNREDMIAAQVGKPIPDEVYSALIDWLELI